jgi:hypothetical protein
MEEKSKIYDRLTQGDEITYQDGSKAEFLVNFNMKRHEEDRYSDEEDQQRIPAPPLILHYDPTEEKGRIFGPSHNPLPQDEEERAQKIQELKDMSKQTETTRKRRKKQFDEKKRAERDKLKKFRAKHNLSPLPSTSEESEVEEEAQSSTPTVTEPVEKKVRYGIREWDDGKIGYNR